MGIDAMEVRTWEDLLEKIMDMSPEQMSQPIQCAVPSPDENDVQELLPGIAIATVEELGFYKCRATHNNKYNPGDVVLLLDKNAHSEDGAIGYDWGTENEMPIYGSDGPTLPSDQMSPQAIADNQ